MFVSPSARYLNQKPDSPNTFDSLKVFGFGFVLLFLMNIQVLFAPPYWDALTGIFSQSQWLKENNFDYFQLWQQPKWIDGGPHIQILYLLAPVYALLMNFFSPPVVFMVIHVFNIFCAALIFLLFFQVLSDFLAKKLALLWCTAAVLDPVFSGQVASLYIEIPQALCYGAVILALHRQYYLGASLACFLAFLVKSSALILALAMLVWFMFHHQWHWWTTSNETAARKKEWRSIWVVLTFPVLYFLARYVNHNPLGLSWNWSKSLYAIKTLLPFQTLTLTAVILAGMILLFSSKQRRQLIGDRALFRLVTFLGIFVGGFWSAYHLYPLPLCRYATGIIFPMAILLALLVSFWGYRVSAVLAVILIIVGAANQYGMLMPVITGAKARSGEHLERSREYLIDLASNRRICRFLEERHFFDPIVVKYPFAHMLTVPEFGYVQRPLPNIYVVGRKPLFTLARDFKIGVKSRDSALYLYVPNVFEYYTQPSLRPATDSEFIYTDNVLGAPAVIYRRGGLE